jgi:hypothetical protein
MQARCREYAVFTQYVCRVYAVYRQGGNNVTRDGKNVTCNASLREVNVTRDEEKQTIFEHCHPSTGMVRTPCSIPAYKI